MKKIFALAGLAIFLFGCEQAEPSFNNRVDDTLTFAGRKWDIKTYLDRPWGPGNNYFSNHPNDVWVDEAGHLHLTISQRDRMRNDGVFEKAWFSTEVISQENMGYGTYIWTIRGNPVDIDKEVVLGLFTWDNFTFQEQANSEVDIEFSKWGVDTTDFTLQYGVQPIAFGQYNEERAFKPEVNNDNWRGVSTHAFTWTDTLITWQSWPGDQYRPEDTVAIWTFDTSNPPKVKEENGAVSDPIVIPAPGDSTNARMNLWLISGITGPGVPAKHEIVIEDFQYIPLP